MLLVWLFLLVVALGVISYFLMHPKCCGQEMDNLGGFGFDIGNVYKCRVCGRLK